MSTAGKCSQQPFADHHHRHPTRNKSCREHENIGIVVLFDKVSKLDIPGKSGADTLVMVKSDGHAVACATDGYAFIYLTFRDRLGKLMCIIRIVTTLRAISAIVDNIIAMIKQVTHYYAFILDTSVVATDSDFHCLKFTFTLGQR